MGSLPFPLVCGTVGGYGWLCLLLPSELTCVLTVLSCRGLPSQAFEYILYNKGLMGEDTYPYRAEVFLVQLKRIPAAAERALTPIPFCLHRMAPASSSQRRPLHLSRMSSISHR